MMLRGIAYLAFVIYCGAVSAASNQLNNVRSYDAPDHLRIVLDFSEKPQYKLLELSGPTRLVIDAKAIKLQLDADNIAQKSRRISDFRTSQNAKTGQLRVVFEVAKYAQKKVFTLPPQGNYKHRLVVDLYDGKQDASKVVKKVEHKGKRDIVIAIDAGHGGEDPGSIGYSGTYEKNVTLTMAKLLGEMINKEPGMKAALTRSGDYYIRPQTRAEIAQKMKADLLISIHADAFTTPQPNGASVWLLSNNRSKTEVGRVLEKKEKRSEILGGVPSIADNAETDKNFATAILSMMQTNSMNEGFQVSQHVLKRMARVTRLHQSKPQHASLAVLTSPQVPSLLVETGFISNRKDEMNLNSRAHRQKLMSAVFTGVKNYFRNNPPQQTLWANWKSNRKQHTVKRGESLSLLASRYKVSIRELKNQNNLRTDHLRIGQVLVIPRS